MASTLSAITLIAYLPENAAGAEQYGIMELRTAAALVNQPRRSRSGDAGPALSLLKKAAGPRDIVAGEHPETPFLITARDEVRAEADRARRVAPNAIGKVALIRFSSGCQVHPLSHKAGRGASRTRL